MLSTGELLPSTAWAQAPFHRTSVLQPRLRLTGYAASHGFTCLKIFGSAADGRPVIDDGPAARTPFLQLHPWPADGARDVPVAGIARGLESPDPYAVLPAGLERAGAMATVAVNGPWDSSLDPRSLVSAASLVPDGGPAIPVTVCDARCALGEHLDGGFGVFARAPLPEATWFQLSAKGVVRADGLDHPFEASWRFQTVRPSAETTVALIGRALVVRTRSPQPVDLTLMALPSGASSALALAGGTRHVLSPGRWRACFTQPGDELWQGVLAPVCAEHVVRAPSGLRLSAGHRVGRRVRFVLSAGRYSVGRRAVLRATGARPRSVVLRARQTLTFRFVRGLHVTVALPAYVRRDGVPLGAGSVARSFGR